MDPDVSPKIKLPMVVFEVFVTVVVAGILMVLKSAVESAPLAMTLPDQFVLVVQGSDPPAVFVHVPFAACAIGEAKRATMQLIVRSKVLFEEKMGIFIRYSSCPLDLRRARGLIAPKRMGSIG